ncbi:hypothetical protein BDQ12DRAFT_723636 [Crucibulum laeve]|uniref:HMG box domain-containing protein n=1 Tax=Crucibulum laeve TaxID=68775 RepID=A0A5C3LZK1_9AGAR|nr:hypothetical protein BDQ12DRAFT_723636 [Crucibulum laeve]
MPAVRPSTTNRRRRSSLAPIVPAKAGIYGIPQRPISFAPNVTPVSFAEDNDSDTESPEPPSPSSVLFPPSESPAPAPTRRRQPPGKRRSQGYIPRPPNAFMLFRADFVRQKHVPGSIETNHGSLSKIIGNCWRQLAPDQKSVWESRAKHAKAEHKRQYPEYRFRPVHNKNKAGTADAKKKQVTTVEEERRCEEVAALLLTGKKGDALAEAVRQMERMRSVTPASSSAGASSHLRAEQFEASMRPPRRSSSVPLPNDYSHHYQQQYQQQLFPTHNQHQHQDFSLSYPMSANGGIALPALPSFAAADDSPPSTAVSSIARLRRPSSAQAAFGYHAHHGFGFGGFSFGEDQEMFNQGDIFSSYGNGTNAGVQLDDEPLPEVNTALFEPSFNLDTGFSFGSQPNSASSIPPHQPSPAHSQGPAGSPFGVDELLTSLHSVAPHDMSAYTPSSSYPTPSSVDSYPTPEAPCPSDAGAWYQPAAAYDPAMDPNSLSTSTSSTAYSGSPESNDACLPQYHQQQQQLQSQQQAQGQQQQQGQVLHAPTPMTPTPNVGVYGSEMWKDYGAFVDPSSMDPSMGGDAATYVNAYEPHAHAVGLGMEAMEMGCGTQNELDSLFQPEMFGAYV